MKITLKYVPSLNAYTTERVENRHLVQAINKELYKGDFWQFGGGYIPAADLDKFMKLALTQYTVIL